MTYKKKLTEVFDFSFVYLWRPEPELQESGVISLKSQNWPNLNRREKSAYFLPAHRKSRP